MKSSKTDLISSADPAVIDDVLDPLPTVVVSQRLTVFELSPSFTLIGEALQYLLGFLVAIGDHPTHP
jgi:hypothetical protein